MKQGQLGDCYFIASLGSIADRNPTAVSNMFIDNGDNTFTVRFYASAGIADYVTVNRQLPTFSNSVLAYSGMGSPVNDASNTLWIALAEKAYAQWNATGKSGRNGTNTYASIEGGWMGAVNAQVLGYNSTNHSLDGAGQTALIAALNTNKAVTIGTLTGASAGGLVGGHAYTVTGYNASTQTFTLVNPWGTSHPAPLTWTQLQSNCSMFVVANPSTTTPIVATSSVRGDVDPASFSFVLTIRVNSNDNVDGQESISVTELASDDQAPTIFASHSNSESLDHIASVLEDLVKGENEDSISSKSIDLALDALMDAINSEDWKGMGLAS